MDLTEENCIIVSQRYVKNAIEYYGPSPQLIKTCEELAEMIQAILKMVNEGGNLKNYIEERADIEIMLAQCDEIEHVSKKAINDMIVEKIRRQKKRMKGEL